MGHVCIRVPALSEKDARSRYAQCETREAWVGSCLGHDGLYVGRPKNDGGWYLSPTVKRGSIHANPFALKVLT